MKHKKQKLNTVKTKKLYFAGKVYDLKQIKPCEVAEDIRLRIDKHAGGKAVLLCIDETKDNMVSVHIERMYSSAPIKVGKDEPQEYVSCLDVNLLLGDGIPGSEMMYANPPIGFGYFHDDYVGDVLDLYNLNAKALGARKAKELIVFTPTEQDVIFNFVF